MNRQTSHAYFRKPVDLPKDDANTRILQNSNSSPKLQESTRMSLLRGSQMDNSDILDRSLSRSGIFLVDKGAAKRRTKKDKQIQKLHEELKTARLKIKQLEQKQIENYVLRRQNQMFRMELEKIRNDIKIYCQQQEHSLNAVRDNKTQQTNSSYKALQQLNLDNLGVIRNLKTDLSHLLQQNHHLKRQVTQQQLLGTRVKSLETIINRMGEDIDSESRQWEVQKQAFVEILHAEIESKKLP